MKATRLTLIGLAAAAIIFGGCSKDNRITGPGMEAYPEISKNQSDLTFEVETESNAARIAVQDDGLAQDRLSIIAEVRRTEVEGGCWYLSSKNGDNYTPLTPKSLTLELGMILKASGYIDKNIQFFCGFGPALVIEEYEILSKFEIPVPNRAHGSRPINEKAANESAQDESSMRQIDKKASIPVLDAAPNSSEDAKSMEKSAEDLTTDRAPEVQKDKKEATKKQSLEDRAPSKWNLHNTYSWSTDDRAPQSVKFDKKKIIETQDSGVSTDDSGPSISPNEIEFSHATEDRAPVKVEYDKRKSIEKQDSGAPSEDRAPSKWNFHNTYSWSTDDRAPDNNSGQADLPTEDRAPQKHEGDKKAAKNEMILARPVPIIYGDAGLSADRASNALEGYTRISKGGCLILTTDNNEVFGLEHDMDVLLRDDTYIRVTGYISTLPYLACEDAPVFHAETIRILRTPEVSNLPADERYAPVNEAAEDEAAAEAAGIEAEDAVAAAEAAGIEAEDDETATEAAGTEAEAAEAVGLEFIEEEGIMHPTEPEGMCWYLENDSGDRYELILSNQVDFHSGMRLKVTGYQADVATFCGSGTPFQVVGWETINENKF